MEPKEITITFQEYKGLTKSYAFLEALEAAGVDNWDGYDYAREIYQENNVEVDDID